MKIRITFVTNSEVFSYKNNLPRISRVYRHITKGLKLISRKRKKLKAAVQLTGRNNWSKIFNVG